jgi:DNA-binding response OmpR family regulator
VLVLLVEDDDEIAEPLAKGLAREGFEVHRVGTAADALERSDARKLALMARVFRAMPYHPD